jgi:hypothetical protein
MPTRIPTREILVLVCPIGIVPDKRKGFTDRAECKGMIDPIKRRERDRRYAQKFPEKRKAFKTKILSCC